MPPGITIAHPSNPDELEYVVSMLDREFVLPKRSERSMSARFPAVYSMANARNIYLGKDDNRVLSALAVKRCTWVRSGSSLRLAMIGCVCTDPHGRGNGFASILLEHVDADCDAQHVDAAVLWTTIPSFYSRLGWQQGDDGSLFGELKGVLKASGVVRITQRAITDEALKPLERIRTAHSTSGVKRSAGDYRVIPLPTEIVHVYMADEDGTAVAYALVGQRDHDAYVYEVNGVPFAYPDLWSAISTACDHVYINEHLGTRSCHWLDQFATVQWSRPGLTMWRRRKGLEIESLGKLHIPYFDRI